jgi:hypothetical protein
MNPKIYSSGSIERDYSKSRSTGIWGRLCASFAQTRQNGAVLSECGPLKMALAWNGSSPAAFPLLGRATSEGFSMKLAVTLIAAGIVGVGVGFVVPAFADEAHIGVGVGPVGAGVSVGSDHRDYDRDSHTTIVKERPVHEHTTVIKKEHHEEPDKKVIIHHDDD